MARKFPLAVVVGFLLWCGFGTEAGSVEPPNPSFTINDHRFDLSTDPRVISPIHYRADIGRIAFSGGFLAGATDFQFRQNVFRSRRLATVPKFCNDVLTAVKVGRHPKITKYSCDWRDSEFQGRGRYRHLCYGQLKDSITVNSHKKSLSNVSNVVGLPCEFSGHCIGERFYFSRPINREPFKPHGSHFIFIEDVLRDGVRVKGCCAICDGASCCTEKESSLGKGQYFATMIVDSGSERAGEGLSTVNGDNTIILGKSSDKIRAVLDDLRRGTRTKYCYKDSDFYKILGDGLVIMLNWDTILFEGYRFEHRNRLWCGVYQAQ